IRDFHVTGVQTCALPISASASGGVQPYTFTKIAGPSWLSVNPTTGAITGTPSMSDAAPGGVTVAIRVTDSQDPASAVEQVVQLRSEERRVGKMCAWRWRP